MRCGVRRVGAVALVSSFIGVDCGAASRPLVDSASAIDAVLYRAARTVLACRDLLRARMLHLRVYQLGYCGPNSNTQIKRPGALLYRHEVVETFQTFCIQLAYCVSCTAIEQRLENVSKYNLPQYALDLMRYALLELQWCILSCAISSAGQTHGERFGINTTFEAIAIICRFFYGIAPCISPAKFVLLL